MRACLGGQDRGGGEVAVKVRRAVGTWGVTGVLAEERQPETQVQRVPQTA